MGRYDARPAASHSENVTRLLNYTGSLYSMPCIASHAERACDSMLSVYSVLSIASYERASDSMLSVYSVQCIACIACNVQYSLYSVQCIAPYECASAVNAF